MVFIATLNWVTLSIKPVSPTIFPISNNGQLLIYCLSAPNSHFLTALWKYLGSTFFSFTSWHWGFVNRGRWRDTAGGSFAYVPLATLAVLPASPVPYTCSTGWSASLGGQLLPAFPHTSRQLCSRVSKVRHLSMNSFSQHPRRVDFQQVPTAQQHSNFSAIQWAMEEAEPCHQRNRCIFWIRTSPPAIHGLTEGLIHHSSQHCVWPRNSFHSKGSRVTGLTNWSYHIYHHPKVASQIDRYKWFLKTQLQSKLKDNILKGWASVLQDTVKNRCHWTSWQGGGGLTCWLEWLTLITKGDLASCYKTKAAKTLESGQVGRGWGVCVWGCFLVIPCPVVKVNEKTITTEKAKMTEGSDPAGMKVWVAPPAKEPRAAEVLADSGEVWNG